MFIWRLETAKGHGVFTCGLLWTMPDEMKLGSRDPFRHPNPQSEGLHIGLAWHCGFRSLAQYRLWFSTAEQRRWLSANGVVLKRYRVAKDDLQIGKAQVIFVKDRASHIASRKPSAA